MLLMLTSCSDEKKQPASQGSAKQQTDGQQSPSTVSQPATAPGDQLFKNRETRTKTKESAKSLLTAIRLSTQPLTLVQQGWKKHWNAAFDQVYHATPQKRNIVEDLIRRQQQFSETLNVGQVSWAGDDDQKQAAIILASLAASIFSDERPSQRTASSELLPMLLKDRLNSLPPTIGDVLTYQIVEETLALRDSRPDLPATAFHNWIELAKGANPVCRLTALKGFAATNVTDQQSISFYAHYADDPEPALANEAIRTLARRGDSQATRTLQRMRDTLPPSSSKRAAIERALLLLRNPAG
jgi:hypothetical protein